MQQPLQRPRHEPVVDEDFLFHGQLGVAALEISGPIRMNPMPERQILRPGRCADGIGLDESEPLNRVGQ